MSAEQPSHAINLPEPSGWKAHLAGTSLVFCPAKGHVPNWFHRKMQELCFGIKWVKVKP